YAMSTLLSSSLQSSAAPPPAHSFPTRRSSDLTHRKLLLIAERTPLFFSCSQLRNHHGHDKHRLLLGTDSDHNGAMTNSAFETTLSQLLDAPRITSVTVARDRVLTTVQQLKQDASGYVNQLWDATDPPVQLTRSDDSVSAAEHCADGRIFFLSTRAAAAADPDAPATAGAKL